MRQAAYGYFLGNIVSRLLNVRKRTWAFIGLGGMALVALLAWAAFALLSWVWGQLPAMTETGRQAAGVAVDRIAQVAPGLKAQLEP